MVLITSCRPMGNHPEYDRNQLAAWKSWHEVAEAIIYFNDPQPQLQSSITRFVPAEPYPRILHMAELAMNQPGWCALINSDIVLSPYFKIVEQKLYAKKALAASSWRHEFDPAIGIEPRSRVDNGLDFFAANPWVWANVYNDIDERMRLGSQRWDSWMLGYFSIKAAVGFYDITPSRCVAHPKHEGRILGPDAGEVHFHAWPVMSRMQIK